MKRSEIGQYLVVDPKICHGKLTFKGTRVPVETVLYFLSTGRSMKSILASWPQLKREAVEESIRLAASALVAQSGAAVETVDEPAGPG